MFQCLLAFLNDIVPFSITSIVSSNVLLVHLLLMIKRLHLLTFFNFLVGSYPKDGGTFSLFWLGSSYNSLHLL